MAALVAWIVTGFALGSTSGCGGELEQGQSTRSGPEVSAVEATAPDELRALGYSGWDDSDDEPETAAGVVHFQDGLADPRWRLWADDRSSVHFVSPAGDERRQMAVPRHTQVEFARALEGGRVLALSVDEGVTLLEPNGEVVWQWDGPAHHEVTVAPRAGDGPGSRLFAVATHHPKTFQGRSIQFDEVLFLEEATGRPTTDPAWPAWSTWNFRAALEEAVAGDPHPLSRPPKGGGKAPAGAAPTYDYFHLNGIAFASASASASASGEAAEGAVATMVVCLRNVSLIAAIALPEGRIVWSVGGDLLDWPHAPSMVTAEGAPPRLLAFDNGTHRGWSRVIEVDVSNGEIQWEWRGPEGRPLWSRVRGFAERLPNGNTLVTESERGRVMEVSRRGAIVWEFLNPDVRIVKTQRQRRRLYRVMCAPSAPGSAPSAPTNGHPSTDK